jgi:hypothetical protein
LANLFRLAKKKDELLKSGIYKGIVTPTYRNKRIVGEYYK